MKDIIAIAKEAGFSTIEDRTIFLSKYCNSPLHDCILKLADLFEAEIRKEFETELSELREVMIAAAEEIHEHWQSHCDDEGYGPQNLMYRLENGIATNYPGYSAGAFQTLTVQNAKLMEALKLVKIFITNTDIQGAITNYPDKPELTLMDVIELALTQPEKEGEEKDPHQDLLDSWGHQHDQP